jgi:protein-tyrosine phosphatase
MDDGADSLPVALQMLESLHAQGVRTVWLTPHFYPYKENLNTFLARRVNAYRSLISAPGLMNMQFCAASEVYLSDYLFNYTDLSELCIGSRNSMLLELPFDSQPFERIYQKIDKLMSYFGISPVLAHIDRYPKIFQDKKHVEALVNLGCMIQVNLNSLSAGILIKRKILNYIENGCIHIVGTDCHNMGSRKPDFTAGISVIEKALGQHSVQQLILNARSIMR